MWLASYGSGRPEHRDFNLHSPDDAVISATLAPIQI